MQVSAISAQNFTSGSDMRTPEDEMEIRAQALNTAITKGRKRAKTLDRAYWSVPLIAAASAGILTGKTSTFLAKEVSGNAAKVANAVKSGAWWSFLLGTAALGGALNNLAERKSESIRKFNQNNPMLSMIGNIAAFLAVTTAVPMAVAAGYGKLSPKWIGRINKGIADISGHLNNIKIPKKIGNFADSISKKSPDWLKTTAKTLTEYAPHITILSALFGSFSNRAKIARDFQNEYNRLSNDA
jgi:hypothetical protein